MSSQRRIIFNADDFGLAPSVNRAVVEAHCEGVLSSASLMVLEPAAEEAAALARACPDLEIGLHLVLCHDRPTVNGLKLFFGAPWMRARVRREIERQIARFRKLVGRAPAHLNGHLNIHVHPTVLPIAAEVAREAGIRAMRLPAEPIALVRELTPGLALGPRLEAFALGRLSGARARRALERRGIRAPDRCFGVMRPFDMTEQFVASVIERLEPGVTEIYFHPGHPLGRAGDPELAALKSERLRRRLRELGVAVVGYDHAVAPDPEALPAPRHVPA